MSFDHVRSAGLRRLVELIQPPQFPIATGSPEAWTHMEHEHGIVIPDDYKEYIGVYGAGAFYGFFEVLSPFSNRNGLFSEHARYRELYRPLVKEYALFPDRGGLLAVGGNDNGDVLFWLTEGNPEQWPLVFTDFWDFERFDKGLCDFLAEWFSGQRTPVLVADLNIMERDVPPFASTV